MSFLILFIFVIFDVFLYNNNISLDYSPFRYIIFGWGDLRLGLLGMAISASDENLYWYWNKIAAIFTHIFKVVFVDKEQFIFCMVFSVIAVLVLIPLPLLRLF